MEHVSNNTTYFYSRTNDGDYATFSVSKDGVSAITFKVSISTWLIPKFGEDESAQNEGWLNTTGIADAELVWNPPAPEPLSEAPTAKQQALDVIQTTLIAINVPPDAAQTLKDNLAILAS